MDQSGDRSEIVFFDVETTIPTLPDQPYAILEFGAILVCPKKLTELHNYSTLVRPANPSLISPRSVSCNGISRDAVATAPTFADIADAVYELLHERVWAGHDISRFDRARIREAFTEINRPPPEPKSMIDSLPLLTRTFGPRAGNMKMASLARYFEIGQQAHRSLDDVRMNLEIVKNCAAVLFLESNFPDVFTENTNKVSPNVTMRSYGNIIGKSLVPYGGSSVMKMETTLVSPVVNHQGCNKEGKRPRTCITMCSSEEGSESNKDAFTEINRPPPQPKGATDSLPLLTQTFGRRAGNMKMATLATYFELGQQTHRSLDDLRMNLEVIKCCATVLFLINFTVNNCVSPSTTKRYRSSIEESLPDGSSSDMKMKSILVSPVANHCKEDNCPIYHTTAQQTLNQIPSQGSELNPVDDDDDQQ